MLIKYSLLKRILLIFFLVFIAACFAAALMRPHVLRLYFVACSDLDQIAPDVYVAPDMPQQKRQDLLSAIDEGKARVSALYGTYSATPVIVAGHKREIMQTYGSRTNNSTGIFLVTPVRAFIVFGPEGLNVDPIAHELAHAEYAARVTYAKARQTPFWFDEGLAVSFDERYTDEDWASLTDEGERSPDISELDPITAHDRLGYLVAQHEVLRWLEVVGQKGFLAFLEQVRSGVDFQAAYDALEQAYR